MLDLLAAATPAPTAAQIWVPAAFSAVATLVGGWLVYRNSRKANAVSESVQMSAQQLAWTQQAMTEATAAKAEAREASVAAHSARDAADQATKRATAAESRLVEVTDVTNKLMDWITRVVRKAHAPGIADGATPAVAELLRVINGGPPEISASQLRHGQGDDDHE